MENYHISQPDPKNKNFEMMERFI